MNSIPKSQHNTTTTDIDNSKNNNRHDTQVTNKYTNNDRHDTNNNRHDNSKSTNTTHNNDRHDN
jgi:hypothetical protein